VIKYYYFGILQNTYVLHKLYIWVTESNCFHYRTIPSRCRFVPADDSHNYNFASIINRPPPDKTLSAAAPMMRKIFRPSASWSIVLHTLDSTTTVIHLPRGYHVCIALDGRVLTRGWFGKKCARNFRYESRLAENSWLRQQRQQRPWDLPPPTN
jgi:hypothetical protein